MRIMIAGGGTAGHINPGIALAKKLLKKQAGIEILFVGTEKGLESKIVPREGFDIEYIRVSGFKRKFGVDTFKTLQKMFEGYSDAKKIINKFKPDVVIGMGGYVCGPVLFCAAMKKIPTLIHEQNAFPGVTNKLLSHIVKTVCISFEESASFFKGAKKVVFTGNPVREELQLANRKTSRDKFDLKPGEHFVAVMGGSLGAEKINQTVIEMIENYYKPGSFKLLFATGATRYDEVIASFAKPIPEGVKVEDYIYDVGSVYAAADLIVCRSGAITLTELAFMGTPSILIPSPNVTANHQEHNALAFKKRGAAFVMTEKELSAKTLWDTINELLSNDSILTKMSKSARENAKPDSVNKIVEEVMNLTKNKTV